MYYSLCYKMCCVCDIIMCYRMCVLELCGCNITLNSTPLTDILNENGGVYFTVG